MLRGPERFSYSPISQRPKYTWRDGRRLALYVTVNVEHFPFGEVGGPDLDRPTQPWRSAVARILMEHTPVVIPDVRQDTDPESSV